MKKTSAFDRVVMALWCSWVIAWVLVPAEWDELTKAKYSLAVQFACAFVSGINLKDKIWRSKTIPPK